VGVLPSSLRPHTPCLIDPRSPADTDRPPRQEARQSQPSQWRNGRARSPWWAPGGGSGRETLWRGAAAQGTRWRAERISCCGWATSWGVRGGEATRGWYACGPSTRAAMATAQEGPQGHCFGDTKAGWPQPLECRPSHASSADTCRSRDEPSAVIHRASGTKCYNVEAQGPSPLPASGQLQSASGT